MPDHLILYSATTKLAYNIAQKFFRGSHYVWCAPRPETDRFGFSNPPSSDPVNIYWRYLNDIKGGDEHSSNIETNRRGLIRGATVKEGQGIIDVPTRQLIEAVVMKAPLSDFSPLLFVIPYNSVRGIVKPADVDARARATSEEYIIDDLPRDCFDVLELHR